MEFIRILSSSPDCIEQQSDLEDMYNETLSELESVSKNAALMITQNPDDMKLAISYISKTSPETRHCFTLLAVYTQEILRNNTPAMLSECADSPIPENKGIASIALQKFKEWYLKRYHTIFDQLSENKNHKKFRSNRSLVLKCIDTWSVLRKKQIFRDETFDHAWNDAWSAYGKNNYTEAIALFKEALGINASLAHERGVLYYIGKCYEELQKYDAAINTYTSSLYSESEFWDESLSAIKAIYADKLPQTEENLYSGVNCFEKIRATPPDESIYDPNSKEWFQKYCVDTIKYLYSYFIGNNESNEVKERVGLAAIEYYRSIRGYFSNIEYRANLQSYIIWGFQEIQRLFESGMHNPDYYLQMIDECQYSLDHLLFPETNPESSWFYLMGNYYRALSEECSLDKSTKILYYEKSAESYDKSAETVGNEWDTVMYNQEAVTSYESALNLADSISSKNYYAEKIHSLFVKYENLIHEDMREYLIYSHISYISNFINIFSMCSESDSQRWYEEQKAILQLYYAEFEAGSEFYEYVMQEEILGGISAAVDLSNGNPVVNSELLEKLRDLGNNYLNQIADSDIKTSVKLALIRTDFYLKNYESVIMECDSLLSGNPDDSAFLLWWKANAQREMQNPNVANTYSDALNAANDIITSLYIQKDMGILLVSQGKYAEAITRYAGLISAISQYENSYAETYYLKELIKKCLKIELSPDIYEAEAGETTVFTASLCYADGNIITNMPCEWDFKSYGDENDGHILNYSNNTATYTAGSTPCNNVVIKAFFKTDLKNIAGIRGDFDSVMEMEETISTPISFILDDGTILKKPVLYFVDENKNHGLVPGLEDEIFIQAEFKTSTSPSPPQPTFSESNIDREILTTVHLFYSSHTLTENYILDYVGEYNDETGSYDLYATSFKDVTLQIYNAQNLASRDMVIMRISNKKDSIITGKTIIANVQNEIPYLILTNMLYDFEKPLDNIQTQNIDKLRILYKSNKNNIPPEYLEIKLKEDNQIYQTELEKYDENQNLYISKKYIKIVQKQSEPTENTIILNSQNQKPILLVRGKGDDNFSELEAIIPCLVANMSFDQGFIGTNKYKNTEQIAQQYWQIKYPVITDLSISHREFYEYLKWSKNIHINCHGLANEELIYINGEPQIKTSFLGIKFDSPGDLPQDFQKYKEVLQTCYKIEESTVQKTQFIQRVFLPECIDFEIDNTKEIVFFNVCHGGEGISKDGIVPGCTAEVFIKKLKPKIFIGWNANVDIDVANNFASMFYKLLTLTKDPYTIKGAFLEAQKYMPKEKEKLVSFPWIDKDLPAGDFYLENQNLKVKK